jgi:hypothetical protein
MPTIEEVASLGSASLVTATNRCYLYAGTPLAGLVARLQKIWEAKIVDGGCVKIGTLVER